MCSGRKKPPEALQVQDHRALRKAESTVSHSARGLETWLSAEGLFGVGNPFPSNSAEQEEQRTGASSQGAENTLQVLHSVGKR